MDAPDPDKDGGLAPLDWIALPVAGRRSWSFPAGFQPAPKEAPEVAPAFRPAEIPPDGRPVGILLPCIPALPPEMLMVREPLVTVGAPLTNPTLPAWIGSGMPTVMLQANASNADRRPAVGRCFNIGTV
jgi:hypothetical protein